MQSHTAVRLTTSNIKEKCRRINTKRKEKSKRKDVKHDLVYAGLHRKRKKKSLKMGHY